MGRSTHFSILFELMKPEYVAIQKRLLCQKTKIELMKYVDNGNNAVQSLNPIQDLGRGERIPPTVFPL